MPEAQTTDRARKPTGGFFSRLGVFVTVLVLALAALELAGLFVPALSADRLDPERKLLESARVAPHPFLAYANKPGFRSDPEASHQISHNSLGFRGPQTTWEKPEGVWRVVCLGGSSTYGHGPTSNATTWPARLQDHLNAAEPPLSLRVEVINGGCQGYSTVESLINLSLRMVDLEPDLVVVYHAINDMRCAIWREPKRDNTQWRALWPVERPSKLDRLMGRTTTWRLLRSLDPAWRAGRSGDLGWYVIVGYGTEDWALTPAAELGFQSVERNLASIVAVAREHGAEVLFGLQATRWSDFDRFGTGADQRVGMQRVLELTREVGAELDVPVVDLAEVLEAEAARQRAESADGLDGVFTSEVHVTDEGADLLARTLARSILELGLVR